MPTQPKPIVHLGEPGLLQYQLVRALKLHKLERDCWLFELHGERCQITRDEIELEDRRRTIFRAERVRSIGGPVKVDRFEVLGDAASLRDAVALGVLDVMADFQIDGEPLLAELPNF